MGAEGSDWITLALRQMQQGPEERIRVSSESGSWELRWRGRLQLRTTGEVTAVDLVTLRDV
jgi:hypothetical protein